MKRGGPLKVHKYLRRRHWMRRKAKPSAYNTRPRDTEYMDWVRAQPCLLLHLGNCWGPVDPDHLGDKPGLGMKAPDWTCAPMCRIHHGEREDSQGIFKAMTPEQRYDWRQDAIAATRSRWLSEQGKL